MIPTAYGRRRPAQPRALKPTLEGLEDRKLLYSAIGGQWPNGSRVSYSFMPDGAYIGGTPSNLYQRMNAEGYSNATWQLQFQKAAAVWEAVANINIAQVGDDGSPLDANGNAQDDPRFGDIRIGGYSANNAGLLAFAFAPPPLNGSTNSGDILLNTDQPFQVNGSAYDLETVAIHEIGHALGMGHSEIASADMYQWYNYAKQATTADDAAGLQSLYGTIPADSIPNNSVSSATNLTPFLVNGQVSVGGARINDPNQDVDYYSITVPANTNGTLTAVMQAGNLSSLSPRIIIYNQKLGYLGQSSQPDTYGGNAVVSIPNVKPGQVLYVRCQAASLDESGIGAYGVLLNFTGQPMPSVAPPYTVVPQLPDQGGGFATELASVVSMPRNFFAHLSGDDSDLFHLGSVRGVGDALMIDPNYQATGPVGGTGGAPKHDPDGQGADFLHIGGSLDATKVNPDGPETDFAPAQGPSSQGVGGNHPAPGRAQGQSLDSAPNRRKPKGSSPFDSPFSGQRRDWTISPAQGDGFADDLE